MRLAATDCDLLAWYPLKPECVCMCVVFMHSIAPSHAIDFHFARTFCLVVVVVFVVFGSSCVFDLFWFKTQASGSYVHKWLKCI